MSWPLRARKQVGQGQPAGIRLTTWVRACMPLYALPHACGEHRTTIGSGMPTQQSSRHSVTSDTAVPHGPCMLCMSLVQLFRFHSGKWLAFSMYHAFNHGMAVCLHVYWTPACNHSGFRSGSARNQPKHEGRKIRGTNWTQCDIRHRGTPRYTRDVHPAHTCMASWQPNYAGSVQQSKTTRPLMRGQLPGLTYAYAQEVRAVSHPC